MRPTETVYTLCGFAWFCSIIHLCTEGAVVVSVTVEVLMFALSLHAAATPGSTTMVCTFKCILNFVYTFSFQRYRLLPISHELYTPLDVAVSCYSQSDCKGTGWTSTIEDCCDINGDGESFKTNSRCYPWYVII